MKASDQLYRLADRTRELEDRAETMKDKAKDDLELDVAEAQAAAQVQAESLSQTAAANQDKISSWWDGVQRSWNEHFEHMRQDIEEKREAHDVNVAQRNADVAEVDAEFAVDYALAAIQEAEYAVLDAALTRMKADELARA